MNKRKRGSEYEHLAASYLEQQGYRILAMNYQNRFGELDILASPARPDIRSCLLVVCEVKYRKNTRCGDPAEALTPVKRKHICRTTIGYYMENRLPDNYPCRFDVICVYGDGSLRHLENAFDFEI